MDVPCRIVYIYTYAMLDLEGKVGSDPESVIGRELQECYQFLTGWVDWSAYVCRRQVRDE